MAVQVFHQQIGQFFVVHIHQGMFQGMGKWPMPNVVQQNSHTGRFCLCIADVYPFGTEYINTLLHQVQGAQGMVKSGM